jgi:hypothetical protein
LKLCIRMRVEFTAIFSWTSSHARDFDEGDVRAPNRRSKRNTEYHMSPELYRKDKWIAAATRTVEEYQKATAHYHDFYLSYFCSFHRFDGMSSCLP